MGTSPDRIATEIDETRANLADDVDRLADRTSPSRIVRRRGERIRGAARRTRDRLMGSGSDADDGVEDKAGQAADSVRATPGQAKRQVEGNPLAAGLVAFGIGALAATLLPGSETERQGARRLRDQTGDAVGSVEDAVSGSAQRVKEDAQSAARDAGRRLGDTARDAATTTGQHAREAGGDVVDRTRGGYAGGDLR